MPFAGGLGIGCGASFHESFQKEFLGIGKLEVASSQRSHGESSLQTFGSGPGKGPRSKSGSEKDGSGVPMSSIVEWVSGMEAPR